MSEDLREALGDLEPPRHISLIWDDDDGWLMTSNCASQAELCAALSEWLFHFATGYASYEPDPA